MVDFLRLLGTKVRTEKTGIISISARWNARTLDEVIEFCKGVDELHGLPRVSAESDQEEDGEHVITAVYEGLASDATGGDGGDTSSSSGEPPTIESLYDFDFDGSMEKSPIQTHPDFDTLVKLYGWDSDKEQFPEYATPFGPQTALGAKASGSERSPVAGTDSWLEVGGEYSVIYAARSVPSSATSDVGTIQVPRGIAQFDLPRDRNFLKLAPKITKRGNAVEVRLRYLMSGPKQWNEPMYGWAQLG